MELDEHHPINGGKEPCGLTASVQLHHAPSFQCTKTQMPTALKGRQ